MNIILPIIFAAVFMGLFSPRMGKVQWCGLGGFIFLVILYNYFKAA